MLSIVSSFKDPEIHSDFALVQFALLFLNVIHYHYAECHYALGVVILIAVAPS
jgi:hypothetical protein